MNEKKLLTSWKQYTVVEQKNNIMICNLRDTGVLTDVYTIAKHIVEKENIKWNTEDFHITVDDNVDYLDEKIINIASDVVCGIVCAEIDKIIYKPSDYIMDNIKEASSIFLCLHNTNLEIAKDKLLEEIAQSQFDFNDYNIRYEINQDQYHIMFYYKGEVKMKNESSYKFMKVSIRETVEMKREAIYKIPSGVNKEEFYQTLDDDSFMEVYDTDPISSYTVDEDVEVTDSSKEEYEKGTQLEYLG